MGEDERRKMAAMMLASARGGLSNGQAAPSYSRQGGRREGRNRHVPVRPREHRAADLACRLLPLLLEAPGMLGFRTAFWAAVAAWGVVLVLSLGCLEVVRW